jgi:hypothetical protein
LVPQEFIADWIAPLASDEPFPNEEAFRVEQTARDSSLRPVDRARRAQDAGPDLRPQGHRKHRDDEENQDSHLHLFCSFLDSMSWHWRNGIRHVFRRGLCSRRIQSQRLISFRFLLRPGTQKLDPFNSAGVKPPVIAGPCASPDGS